MLMALSLDPARTAVLVIDLQNDNLADDGAAGGTESIPHAREVGVVEHAAEVAQAARESGAPVIHVHFVIDPAGGGAGRNIPLFAGITDTPTVVRGTYGAQPFPGAEPHASDIVIDRPRMNAFHGTALDTMLRNLGITHIVLTGVHTNHAVNTTARAAADAGYTPILVTDATASTTADAHRGDLRYGFADIAELHDTTTVVTALTGN
jgi:nicotinamidase-related amidase